MRAARAVLRRNVGTFDVERFHGAAFRSTLANSGEIAQCTGHDLGRARDHGREKTRYAGRIHAADGVRDRFGTRLRVVVVDTRESVYLYVDETGRDVDALLRRDQQMINAIDHAVERNLGMFPCDNINAVTFHDATGLYTSFPQQHPAKWRNRGVKYLLKKIMHAHNCSGVNVRSLVQKNRSLASTIL